MTVVQDHLGLHHLQFSAEELESCLVLNNGTSGLLPNLHIVSFPIPKLHACVRLDLKIHKPAGCLHSEIQSRRAW